MSRAKWKSPFVSSQLLQECNGTTKEIYTQSRESTIVPMDMDFQRSKLLSP